MPTVTFTFDWDAGLEGFHVSTLGAATLGWFFGDGDPSPGCLQIRANALASGTCDLVNSAGLTWESLGVPPGATVTRAGFAWHVRNLHPVVSPDTHNTLEIGIENPEGGSVFAFPFSTNLTQYSASWGTDGAGTAAVNPAYGPSIQPIFIRLHHIFTAADGEIEVHFDTLTLTITHGDVVSGEDDPEPEIEPPPLPTAFGSCPCTRTTRAIPSAFAAHLQGECLTLAQCLQIARTDGGLIALTTFDEDLVVNGVTYVSLAGLQTSALRQELGSGVDNMDFHGLLLAGFVAETDVLSGLYDGAVLRIYLCNWADPTQFLLLVKGSLGRVELQDGRYLAEFRSLGQGLAGTVGQVLSAGCRVKMLGDSDCAPGGLFADGKVLADYQFTRTVASAVDSRNITFAGESAATGYYTYGRCIYVTGLNAGQVREIKAHTLSAGTAVIELQQPFPFAVSPGDTATLEAGCNRLLSTCRTRFNNSPNFKGEPYVAGFTAVKYGKGKKKSKQ